MEGLAEPADLHLIGCWERMLDGLGEYAEAGVTDFRLEVAAPDARRPGRDPRGVGRAPRRGRLSVRRAEPAEPSRSGQLGQRAEVVVGRELDARSASDRHDVRRCRRGTTGSGSARRPPRGRCSRRGRCRRAPVRASRRTSAGADGIRVVVRAQQHVDEAEAANGDVRPRAVGSRERAGVTDAGGAPADRPGADPGEDRARRRRLHEQTIHASSTPQLHHAQRVAAPDVDDVAPTMASLDLRRGARAVEQRSGSTRQPSRRP